MSAVLDSVLDSALPLPVRARRVRRDTPSLAWCVLGLAVLLEVALRFFPQAMLLNPVQSSVAFKQASGYTMLALIAFAMTFGWMRRHPALADHQRKLNEFHQLAGLVILVLLAFHVGQRPSGFLLYSFHALAVGVGAGALRTVIGKKIGRKASMALLVLHISLSCLVAAAVLLHLWFVYAYTA